MILPKHFATVFFVVVILSQTILFGHLTENCVTFTAGRDLDLVPKQTGDPLNFFIYPHVEVDDRKLPTEQVKLTVTFKDE